MVVDDLPTLRSPFHHQRKWAAASHGAAPHEEEPCRDQRRGRAQRPDLHFFKVKAVAPGPRSKPGSVVLPDEVNPLASSSAVNERRRAFGSIVGNEAVEISPVPVAGRPVQL